jgi:glutathione-regulated potassium-efflux system ancillary protein KefC
MGEELLLLDLFYYFAATAILIPIFNILGLGSVLGYLTAGMLMGPHCFNLLYHGKNIHDISQMGIIMLMFVIGLELTPNRLSHLKKTILLEGTIQYLATSAIFFALFMMSDWSWKLSLLVSVSLSLSSTAFSLSWLKENDCLTKSYGQSSIGILIFQDLIIIPLLAIIPFMAPESQGQQWSAIEATLKILSFFGLVGFARFGILPLLNKVYAGQAKEVFIASCLMFVIGTSLLMGHLGLSKALGAFVAGMFLSNSQLKSEIQSFSLPLKAMAMGVFFMGFGLALDIHFFTDNFLTITGLSLALVFVKSTLLFFQGLVVYRRWQGALSLSLILSQGGEFGLLAIGLLTETRLLSQDLGQMIISAITLSIFMGPFMGKLILLAESKRKGDMTQAEVICLDKRIQVPEEKIIEEELDALPSSDRAA